MDNNKKAKAKKRVLKAFEKIQAIDIKVEMDDEDDDEEDLMYLDGTDFNPLDVSENYPSAQCIRLDSIFPYSCWYYDDFNSILGGLLLF